MRKVNDDICAIDIEAHNEALDLLRDRFNLNKIIRPLDKHVVLKNYNHIHELHDFPAFVVLNDDIAEPVASALDNVSIKMYYDDVKANPSLFDIDYIKMSMIRTNTIYHELISVVFHPDKVKLALDYHMDNGGNIEDFDFV